ncbi:hypothetical protein [Pyrobaculum aerophilum]|nr:MULTISPECIES: hypothetical protein [Pyrobaculum]MCX8136833.1 hypothetical protein [Pyrobaculum aerophilum]
MCRKEIQLKRGWACVVDGVYVPEGALVLTRPPGEILAHREAMSKAFFQYLGDENLAENSVVITDGKGESYAFIMPGAKLTVVLYVDDPWAEADLLIRYLDGTLRGNFLDRRARMLFYEKRGQLALSWRVVAPKLPVEAPAVERPAPAAAAPAPAGGLPAGGAAPAPPASAKAVEPQPAAGRLPSAEELCGRLSRDPAFLKLVAIYAVVYDKFPERAKAAVEELFEKLWA